MPRFSTNLRGLRRLSKLPKSYRTTDCALPNAERRRSIHMVLTQFVARTPSLFDFANSFLCFAGPPQNSAQTANTMLGMFPISPRDVLRIAAEKGFANERAQGQKAGDLFGGGAGDGEGGATEGGTERRPGK